MPISCADLVSHICFGFGPLSAIFYPHKQYLFEYVCTDLYFFITWSTKVSLKKSCLLKLSVVAHDPNDGAEKAEAERAESETRLGRVASARIAPAIA